MSTTKLPAGSSSGAIMLYARGYTTRGVIRTLNRVLSSREERRVDWF